MALRRLARLVCRGVVIARSRAPIAARSASQVGEWAGEQRASARRSKANRYEWLSAAERYAGGALHMAQLNPAGSPLQTVWRGIAAGRARRSRKGTRVERCVAVGSQETDCSKQTQRTVSGSVRVRIQTFRQGRPDTATPDEPGQVPDGRRIRHGTCVFRMPSEAAPSVRYECCWPA